MLKQHPHVAKTFRYPKHIYKHVEHHGKMTFLGFKVYKAKKKGKIWLLFQTKGSNTQKIQFHTQFSLNRPTGREGGNFLFFIFYFFFC